MKVVKLAILIAIAFGVWFQFVGNVYETGRWRLSEECGGISSDRVRAMWVSAQIAPLNVNNDGHHIWEYAMATYNDIYAGRHMRKEDKKPLRDKDRMCLAWLLAHVY